ncbi:MAG: DUF368 domain-containing protein [Chloroflexota bacterium]
MTKQSHLTNEDLSQPRKPLQYLRLYLSGFAMGSADIVPGVSGGTMAFILGIYGTLIDAIKSFNFDVLRRALRFDIAGIFERVPFRFLIALGMGVLSAILLLASLLHNLLETQPTFVFAFFAGLIIASIVAIGVKVRWSPQAMAALLAAAVFAFFLVGIEGAENDRVDNFVAAVESGEGISVAETALLNGLEENNYPDAAAQVATLREAVAAGESYEGLADEFEEALYNASSPLVLFVSGAIAICAMILPGISGSFILLILGQYTIVLGAVKALDIVSLGAVALGAAVGIMLFSRVISWLLRHYENVTVAALVGFMAGSLRLIWLEAQKGIEVVNETGQLASNQWVTVVALIVFGFVLVSFLDHLQARTNPVFAWFWKPAPVVDDLQRKAEALD